MAPAPHVSFPAAHEGGPLIPSLGRPHPAPAVLPARTPLSPPPPSPSWSVAAPFLQLLKLRTLQSFLTILSVLQPVLHPSGNPGGLSGKIPPDPAHSSPPGSETPCALSCFLLSPWGPRTPTPTSPRLCSPPSSHRILINGQSIHVTPLLTRLQQVSIPLRILQWPQRPSVICPPPLSATCPALL